MGDTLSSHISHAGPSKGGIVHVAKLTKLAPMIRELLQFKKKLENCNPEILVYCLLLFHYSYSHNLYPDVAFSPSYPMIYSSS